jgi:hypothetical protein
MGEDLLVVQKCFFESGRTVAKAYMCSVVVRVQFEEPQEFSSSHSFLPVDNPEIDSPKVVVINSNTALSILQGIVFSTQSELGPGQALEPFPPLSFLLNYCLVTLQSLHVLLILIVNVSSPHRQLKPGTQILFQL